jgi:hypothetical protein
MKLIRIVVVLSFALGVSTRLRAENQEPMRFLKGEVLQKLELTRTLDDDSKRQAMANLPKRKSDFAYPIWTVPTMANVQGQFGAFFKTRLAMFNPTTLSFVVAASLFNEGGLVNTRQIELPANSYKVWDDFLGTGFGYNGAGGVEFDSWFIPVGGSETYEFFVTAEVYTDSPNGRYKTVVVNGIQPQALTGLRRATSIGLNVNANERTNLGVLNDAAATANVRAEVYDSSGQLVETLVFTIPPRGWAQQPITTNITEGRVEWKTDNMIYAWSVSVDNRSNDGSLNYPTYYVP